MANASTSITISFDGTSEPRDVVLTIKDWCTDLIIPGAIVTLTVNDVPTTKTSDANGSVTFPLVPVGTHPLAITAAGYLNSATDSLANDSVTV